MTTTPLRAKHGYYQQVHTMRSIVESLQAFHREHGYTPTKLDWECSRPVGAAHEYTIRRRYGSWNQAVMAAGLEPNTVGRKKAR